MGLGDITQICINLGNGAMQHYGWYLPGDYNTDFERDCVILLFRSWVLDTPVKYAFAFLGIFLMAILVQALAFVRRVKLQTWAKLFANKINKSPKNVARMMDAMVYFIHTFFIFILMMISMDFSFPLFSAIIFGLSVGYMTFEYNPQ